MLRRVAAICWKASASASCRLRRMRCLAQSCAISEAYVSTRGAATLTPLWPTCYKLPDSLPGPPAHLPPLRDTNSMRRLMAVPMSVAMLMFVIQTSAAQSVNTSSSGSLGQGNQDKNAPAATPGVSGSLNAGASAAPTTPAATTPAAATPAAPAASATTPAANNGAAGAAAPFAAEAAPGADTNVAVKEEAIDSGTYGVRLRDLEQRINELKEQIFRSKARLSLLAETVLQGVVAGSQARIVHENKMGNSYRLVKVVYALDGAPIFNKADEEGALGEQDEFDIYNGSIVPGEHTLTVKLEYRGHGYGIFSYLKGYRFKVSSSHTFTAPEGKALTLSVVGYEKGGPTAPLEERPAVRFVERVSAAVQAPAQAGAEGG